MPLFLSSQAKMKKNLRLALAAGFFLTAASPAYAYLDPVSVTFILQGIVGAVAAVLAGFRSVRMKLALFFKSLIGQKNDQ